MRIAAVYAIGAPMSGVPSARRRASRSGDGSSVICTTKGFPFVSHRGAQTRPAAMICSSGPLQRIFTSGRRSPGGG